MNYDLLLILLIMIVFLILLYYLFKDVFPNIWNSLNWAGHKVYSAVSTAGKDINKGIAKVGITVATPTVDMILSSERAGNYIKAGIGEYATLWQKGAETIARCIEGIPNDVKKDFTVPILTMLKWWKL